ncbi:MAG: ABC transporter permease subunit, partial [Candidatus Lambdaproteobacteria bacterium]|nr:ABC transporter permease subunit [Candidatus Lambdaproteobacteria bacterium]
IHPLQPHQAPVTRILATANNKALLSVSADGRLLYDYTTNQRHLLSLTPAQPPAAVGLSTRSNGAIAIDGAGEVTLWALHVPHPEASWRTFFGKLWYEGFPEPEYTWQSSAGTEDFEPKLSLVPLIFGTVKGTLYGLLFAAPLAVFAALYSSHLMNPRLHRVIKPTFEIMGAIPTVVIGFIAALWLAPLVRVSLGALLLLLVLLPLLVMLGVGVWERVTALGAVRKVLRGYEFLLLVPVVLLGVGLAAVAGRVLEVWLFGGDLPLWLFQHLGVHFDQRNSIIIAFGLGFAVLPTVYTISDDALTNVPRNLTAASLALGASRWQTVWRVVLPSASPGIFAALMVGFGRAVGETMIVLMATGNTPITDWSIFNGMRTLSANIAVEIPEAPFEGTLYRTLFLSAVLLFLTTFVLNTAAEMVRQRLRKKFGQF